MQKLDEIAREFENEKMNKKTLDKLYSNMQKNMPAGPMYMTPEEAIIGQKSAMNNCDKNAKTKFNQTSYHEHMARQKNTKIIREGYKCAVIHPNGKKEMNIIQKGKEDDFFDNKIGPGWKIYNFDDLAYGILAGSVVYVAFNEESKMKLNKIATNLMDKNIRGSLVIWSEGAQITKELIGEITQEL